MDVSSCVNISIQISVGLYVAELGFSLSMKIMFAWTSSAFFSPEETWRVTFSHTSLTSNDDHGVLSKELLYLFKIALSYYCFHIF